MNVSLTPELEQLIRDQVRSGRYLSEDEVIREALRLLEERDWVRQRKREDLKRELTIGLDELDRGEGRPLDMEAIRAEARRILAAEQEGHGAPSPATVTDEVR